MSPNRILRISGWLAGAALAVTVAFAGCAGTGAKVEGKIGVIDAQRILDNTNAGKRAKDNLVTFPKTGRR